MKRLHVSFAVKNLATSVQFYSHLFGEQPTVQRADYAKWMLEDPRVNFVVEQASDDKTGFTHAGIQTESEEELAALLTQMETADAPYAPEGETTCCYHKSKKGWTTDPDGVMWEGFYTFHETEERGQTNIAPPAIENVCCS